MHATILRRSTPALFVIILAAGRMSSAAIVGAIFDVNSTADAPDAQIDGTCATAATPPVCTLRAAIQEANATADGALINLPAGKYTLKLVGADDDAAASGDLDVTHDLIINGADAKTTVLKGKKDRVLQISDTAVVTLRDITISKGKVGKKDDSGDDVSGGGIRNDGTLTLERVAVTGNSAAHEGGGIISIEATLTLTDVTVASNKTLGDDGGGLEIDGGTAALTNVTISKNKSADEAGGLHSTNGAVVTMTNCTVSGNSAKAVGGGLRSEAEGALTLTNVTITGNKAKLGAGGIGAGATAVVLRNVILNKNKPLNCTGALDLQGSNLETGDSCGLSPAESNIKKMGLAGLKNNGGPTKTHALKVGSPAIDFGTDANCPVTDQRGQTRVDVVDVGPTICDSGAYEFVPAP
jgi:CSLREA domain-containing protein